ncbi:myotubularin-related protein 6 isoform X2 [Macrosteles quadrilineatus]|uniref:myotubularin-related protein 6 isoform X2 n=1 Tax=Macrosteles quadrilineatus TaxID=74068 RepID=UPI0023E2C252|nr:myotubularin-related protein 6 isoform X2 [Macrosteles quadrilineatus]
MSYLEEVSEEVIGSSLINSATKFYQAATMAAPPLVYGKLKNWLSVDDACSPADLELCGGQKFVKKVENVRMLDRYNLKSQSQGVLFITPTHLIFTDHVNKKEMWVLFMHIASVDKLPLTTTGSPLHIRCKMFLSVTFVIPRERDCHEVYTNLQQLSQPVHIEELYCFHYSSRDDIPKAAGWSYFDLQSEFQRMGVPNEQWHLMPLNKFYEICDTYPRVLYVPASATTNILVSSSQFRSKGRLPVLTYLHTNKAAICRCSQPLSGFSARCVEDEQMLDCILQTNPNAKYMYVVDTRPKINAMANRAAGKGYESENFYENIKFHFLGIENIHVMRSSLAKLIETCELKSPSMNSFLAGLESSGWLRHIKSILDTSMFIANAIDAGISVVVHCSDGWDRTAQVCALATLLLDSYYRTVQGYQALIEKEWLAFGHKFTDRCGHIAGDPKEISPVFTQFVECTWQLCCQFPSAFQFNERFLLCLHDHVTSCQYGTFIGNCEKDRLDLRLHERTYSLWGFMANHMHEYLNPLYSETAVPGMMRPNLAPQTIKFWRGMYCRFESGIHPRENLEELLLTCCDHSSSLEDHIKLLQKRITALKTKLASVGERVKSEVTKDSPQTIDNKLLYDKVEEIARIANSNEFQDPLGAIERKLSSDKEPLDTVACAVVGDDPLKGISSGSIKTELESVALDWKPFRNVKECQCSTHFDHFMRKYHCWRCGDVCCTRCTEKHVELPGHLSQRAVPVCTLCYRRTKHPSEASP